MWMAESSQQNKEIAINKNTIGSVERNGHESSSALKEFDMNPKLNLNSFVLVLVWTVKNKHEHTTYNCP